MVACGPRFQNAKHRERNFTEAVTRPSGMPDIKSDHFNAKSRFA